MKLRHVLPLLAVVSTSLFSSAQLDPRERYGTYLGGSKSVCTGDALGCGTSTAPTYAPASTYATAAVADGFGNVYVAGATDAVDFPTTTGAYHRTVNISNDDFGASHSDDTFITKFDSSGRVVWSTYLGIQTGILGGPPQNGGITGIAADAAGNTYVSGTSDLGGFGRYSADTPFLLKLNASGSAVLYKNFIAAGCDDLGTVGTGEGIALDSAGFAYLVGSDFFNCVNPTPAASQNGNSFVLKIDTTKAPAQSIVYAAKVFNFNPPTLRPRAGAERKWQRVRNWGR